MYKKILVPLDGSTRAEAIIPHVEDLASCYDAIGQLTSFSYPGRDVTYNYDPAGNRTSVVDTCDTTTSYTTNEMNQYTQVGSTTYIYDDDGNMIRIESLPGANT